MSWTFSFGCLSFSHLNFETEVCHARCLPQAELGSNHFTISHNEVKEKRCSAAHFDSQSCSTEKPFCSNTLELGHAISQYGVRGCFYYCHGKVHRVSQGGGLSSRSISRDSSWPNRAEKSVIGKPAVHTSVWRWVISSLPYQLPMRLCTKASSEQNRWRCHAGRETPPLCLMLQQCQYCLLVPGLYRWHSFT